MIPSFSVLFSFSFSFKVSLLIFFPYLFNSLFFSFALFLFLFCLWILCIKLSNFLFWTRKESYDWNVWKNSWVFLLVTLGWLRRNEQIMVLPNAEIKVFGTAFWFAQNKINKLIFFDSWSGAKFRRESIWEKMALGWSMWNQVKRKWLGVWSLRLKVTELIIQSWA